jgi:hypothetical protein
MADAFEDNLDRAYETLKKQFGERVDVPNERRFHCFDAFKKAIDSADLVLLCTPPGFRPPHFEYAVEQGKHVFMEKPVAVDCPGIRKVIEAAKAADKKNLKVVCGLQRHYQNSYLETLEKTKAGMIGEQHIHNLGVRKWFMGTHPAKANGIGGRSKRIGKEWGEIFDHHYVEYTYPDGTINNAYQKAESTLTTIMGRMATYSGQEITWEQALNPDLDTIPKVIEWDAEPGCVGEMHRDVRWGRLCNRIDEGFTILHLGCFGGGHVRIAVEGAVLVTGFSVFHERAVEIPCRFHPGHPERLDPNLLIYRFIRLVILCGFRRADLETSCWDGNELDGRPVGQRDGLRIDFHGIRGRFCGHGDFLMDRLGGREKL